MVEANVDKIMQALNEKNKLSISDLSKKLSLPKEDVQKSVEYLEEDGVVKIDHKFPGSTVTLIKKDAVKKPEMPPPPQISENKPEQPPPIQPIPSQPPQLPPPPQKDTSQTISEPPKIDSSPGLPPPPKKEGMLSPAEPPKDLKNDIIGKPQIKPDLPKPPETINDKTKIEQSQTLPPPPQKDSSQTLQPPFETKEEKLEKVSFLTEEQKKEEPKIITPTQSENMKASLDIMQPTPVDTLQNKEPEKFDLENNPLNEGKPKFEMKTPSPMDYPVFPSMGAPAEMKTNMGNSLESPRNLNDDNQSFPSHIESELDKIEYLLDKLENKLNNHEYKNINTLYRQIYELYNNSYDLSINERTLVNDKIQQMYQRLKRVYIIEGVT